MPENKTSTTDVDIQTQRQDTIQLFEENLVDTLMFDDVYLLEELNDSIIEILSADQKFKKEIENIIYNCQETVAGRRIKLNKKTVEPSVSNWLKDFIGKWGTGMFNDIQLTEYITSSENGKKLTSDEKLLLRKLLVMYRNIKFFPESLKDKPVEDWEIIPLPSKRTGQSRIGYISGPPKTEEEKEIEELKSEESHYEPGSLEQLALEEEIENKRKIEDLKIEAKRYQVGSIERMVLEEEIDKLERQSR